MPKQPPAPGAGAADNWEERRSAPRVSLDRPVFARLFMESHSGLQVMIVDISPGGSKLSLPPSSVLDGVSCGLPVTLDEFPVALSPLNGLRGVLAWKSKGNCGIQFDEELGAPLEALIGQKVRL
ncbi:MAG: PilZ domain-containing protein [Deltaproteobacteria bacterium]|jgi:hypothetical protein|nr:PilZ domain-containing protein [Deltaproteobacteria bacterium]